MAVDCKKLSEEMESDEANQRQGQPRSLRSQKI